MIRESADRALERGVDRDKVLEFIADVRPELSHMKIALLADWRYSIKDLPPEEFVRSVKDSGADGLLVHGLPPFRRASFYEVAREAGQPIVSTCYSSSEPKVIDEAAEYGSAYIYLVSAYGRSGTVGPPDHSALVPVIEALRANSDVPIAVGFGVKTAEDIDGLGAVGADAAIIGSSCVKCVAEAQAEGRDVIEDFSGLLADLGVKPTE